MNLFSMQIELKDWIHNTIQEKLNPEFLEVKDLTGGGDHFEARVVSSAFEGKTMVAQHQLVYKALGDAMKERVHALALKTYTPNQWAKQK